MGGDAIMIMISSRTFEDDGLHIFVFFLIYMIGVTVSDEPGQC